MTISMHGKLALAAVGKPTRSAIVSLLPAGLCLAAACSAPTATRTSTGQVGGAEVTAVFSRVSNKYSRVQMPDGTFQAETYLLKNGGNFGGPNTDATMDKLDFDDISRVIAGPLATQNYMATDDGPTTKLLIVAYWGKTLTPQDIDPRENRESAGLKEMATKEPSMAASLDEQSQNYSEMEASYDGRIDARSANILGYTDEIFRTSSRDPKMDTLRDEIEESRYYVVLLAYDYQAARKHGEHRLLWETRFSIPERGNDFEKAFPAMSAIAARYFGQDSHGLVHHNLGEGRVEIGEPKSLGTVPVK
jgi:hypothetical protein